MYLIFILRAFAILFDYRHRFSHFYESKAVLIRVRPGQIEICIKQNTKTKEEAYIMF